MVRCVWCAACGGGRGPWNQFDMAPPYFHPSPLPLLAACLRSAPLLVLVLFSVVPRGIHSFSMPLPVAIRYPAHPQTPCSASAGRWARSRAWSCIAARKKKSPGWVAAVQGADDQGTDRPGRLRVAVVGSGAVGLYYGARLLEAGHDVYFVARSDLDVLKRNGLKVESVDGDMRFESVKVYGRAEDIGKVDWVVLALKTYALPAVLPQC